MIFFVSTTTLWIKNGRKSYLNVLKCSNVDYKLKLKFAISEVSIYSYILKRREVNFFAIETCECREAQYIILNLNRNECQKSGVEVGTQNSIKLVREANNSIKCTEELSCVGVNDIFELFRKWYTVVLWRTTLRNLEYITNREVNN